MIRSLLIILSLTLLFSCQREIRSYTEEINEDVYSNQKQILSALFENDSDAKNRYSASIPVDWREGQASGFRQAEFIPLAGKEEAVIVSALADTSINAEANLRRWAGQLGLNWTDEVHSELIENSQVIPSPMGQWTLYNFSKNIFPGINKNMLVAILHQSDKVLYVKQTYRPERSALYVEPFKTILKTLANTN